MNYCITSLELEYNTNGYALITYILSGNYRAMYYYYIYIKYNMSNMLYLNRILPLNFDCDNIKNIDVFKEFPCKTIYFIYILIRIKLNKITSQFQFIRSRSDIYWESLFEKSTNTHVIKR